MIQLRRLLHELFDYLIADIYYNANVVIFIVLQSKNLPNFLLIKLLIYDQQKS